MRNANGDAGQTTTKKLNPRLGRMNATTIFSVHDIIFIPLQCNHQITQQKENKKKQVKEMLLPDCFSENLMRNRTAFSH